MSGVSLAEATAWVQAAIREEELRDGRPLALAAVRKRGHGWLFVCLPPGADSSTRSPFIVDRRDGAVYRCSSVIGSERAVEVIRSGPAAVGASRRVFRVGVIGVGPDAEPLYVLDHLTKNNESGADPD